MNEQEVINRFWENYYVLYETMSGMTHVEYRKEFSNLFDEISEKGIMFLPNTLKIEQKEFDTFGKWWYELEFDML